MSNKYMHERLQNPATELEIFDAIAEGSTLFKWCRDNNASFTHVGRWIAADKERQKKFATARALREEYLGEAVLHKLTMFLQADLSQAYDAQGRLLSPADMPESIRLALAGVDISWNGSDDDPQQTVKIKMVDPLKSTELMGKYLKIFSERSNDGPGSAGEIAHARIMEGAALMDQRLNAMRLRLQQQEAIDVTEVTITESDLI